MSTREEAPEKFNRIPPKHAGGVRIFLAELYGFQGPAEAIPILCWWRRAGHPPQTPSARCDGGESPAGAPRLQQPPRDPQPGRGGAKGLERRQWSRSPPLFGGQGRAEPLRFPGRGFSSPCSPSSERGWGGSSLPSQHRAFCTHPALFLPHPFGPASGSIPAGRAAAFSLIGLMMSRSEGRARSSASCKPCSFCANRLSRVSAAFPQRQERDVNTGCDPTKCHWDVTPFHLQFIISHLPWKPGGRALC